MERTEDPQESEEQRVLADGTVEIDLADPPTREDLAVPEGRRTFFLERPDKEPYEVVVTFTDGTTLRTPASVLGVTTDGTGDPTALAVVRTDLTFEELEEALRGGVEQLGVDEARVEAYLRAAREAGTRRTTVKRALPSRYVAPELLELVPITHGFDGRQQIDYMIRWEE